MAMNTVEQRGNVYVARHGTTNANAEWRFGIDTDVLNEQGWRDAERLRRDLQGVSLTKILGSPLPRARQTTEPIRTERGLDLIVIPELREHDFGTLKGKPYPKCCMNAYDAVAFAFFHENEHGGERAEDVYIRAVTVRETIIYDYKNENTLLLTHGVFGIFLSLAFEGVDWRCSDAEKGTGMFDKSRGLKNGEWWNYKINNDGSIIKVKR